MIPLTGTSRLPRRIFPCVHMEYFVPLAEMKLHCSSIISVCKTSTFQSSNTNYLAILVFFFVYLQEKVLLQVHI